MKTKTQKQKTVKNVVTIRKDGSRRVSFNTGTVSKVEQSHKGQSDINKIVSRYQKSGLFPQRTDRPTYGDFTGCVDFHEAHNRIHQAAKDFLSLPSEIRNRFHNDCGEMLEFINDPENVTEAREMGLLPKLGETPPVVSSPITEPPEPVPEPPTEPTER